MSAGFINGRAVSGPDLVRNGRCPTTNGTNGVLASALNGRPSAGGKFVFVSGQKLYVRGVTYGTFRPQEDGHEYPLPAVVEQDFATMAENGITAVRTYTVPPRWLLDAASRHGLRLMVGVPVERYVGYLTDNKEGPDIEKWVRSQVRSIGSHPAVLCYAIGNEIPGAVVRWLGRRRTQRFLERLYLAAKDEDPKGLVTYVNYPSTEYLDLPFLDLVCFNVYLESEEPLEAYLARLQNIAGERPLILSEIGLDSQRNGEATQAANLGRQVRMAFRAGCAGAFVYAWTDEWHAGGVDMLDWDFGLTRRDRKSKPALADVRTAFAEAPFPRDTSWPLVSVVLCSYNGQRTIRDCLEGLAKLDYPNFEVIVVDDGSTDNTGAIAREYERYGFRVIHTEQLGLSNARNTGLEAAAGEIVAYLDDDAYPDPQWLTYLAATFASTEHAAVGGPNIAPPGDGPSECFASAPGTPVHVLLSDVEAEHIPGCNMAFRRTCLEEIGGFDPQYRAAGDDVDVCWRLQKRGWTLGYSPAAMVWHHPRSTVRTYWKQQYGYGKAEALLEAKWPEKYNVAGQLAWAGRIYSKAPAISNRLCRIYHGVWGSAPFQRLYQPTQGWFGSFYLTPEWYLLNSALAIVSVLGVLWTPLFWALPLFLLGVVASLSEAWVAGRIPFRSTPPSRLTHLRWRLLTAFLFLIQPLARLRGRLQHGLTPWRRPSLRDLALPWPRQTSIWTEAWQGSEQRLEDLEALLRSSGAPVLRGGDFDRWDLEVRGGFLGAARILTAVEEHGQGRQLVRFRTWPTCYRAGTLLFLLGGGLAAGAAFDGAWAAAAVFGFATAVLLLRGFHECAASVGAARRGIEEYGSRTASSRQAR